jgi:hypothetical protein
LEICESRDHPQRYSKKEGNFSIAKFSQRKRKALMLLFLKTKYAQQCNSLPTFMPPLAKVMQI